MQDTIQASSHLGNPTVYLDLPWQPSAEPAPGPTDRKTVLYLGRLSFEKGVDKLLRAWRTVERSNPALQLRIAGDGPYRTNLERLMRELKLEHVQFTGRYHPAEVGTLLRDALVTVHPSIWHENSPFTVRESLQSGVPAIVADRGGMPEMVGRWSGSVIDPEDPDKIAAEIIAESKAKRAGSGRLTHEVKERAVSDSQHLKGITQVYESLISQSSRSSLDVSRRTNTSETVPPCGS